MGEQMDLAKLGAVIEILFQATRSGLDAARRAEPGRVRDRVSGTLQCFLDAAEVVAEFHATHSRLVETENAMYQHDRVTNHFRCSPGICLFKRYVCSALAMRPPRMSFKSMRNTWRGPTGL